MLVLNLINVCAQYEQTGRNADKIPHHTCKVNYVRMVLHCAMLYCAPVSVDAAGRGLAPDVHPADLPGHARGGAHQVGLPAAGGHRGHRAAAAVEPALLPAVHPQHRRWQHRRGECF